MAGGKPSNFSPEQVAVLVQALNAYKAANPGNQTKLGKLLGVGQQSVSNFLNGRNTFFYGPASKIATLAGFAGLDALFAAHGVAPPGVTAPADIPGLPADMPTAKRTATRLALEAGASPRAILHICTAPEWTADSHRGRQVDWWFSRMMETHRADDEPLPAGPAQLAAEKGQTTRKANATAKAATEARSARTRSQPQSSVPPSAKKKVAS